MRSRRRTLAQILLRRRGRITSSRIGTVPADVQPGKTLRIDTGDEWVLTESEPLEGKLAERRVVCEPSDTDSA